MKNGAQEETGEKITNLSEPSLHLASQSRYINRWTGGGFRVTVFDAIWSP